MRPLLAILIAMFLLGGTYAYTKFAASVRATAADYETTLAADIYSVEIRRTFTAVPALNSNPNSLTNDHDSTNRPPTSALKLLFQGQILIERDDEIPTDEAIELASLPDVEIGVNELFVSAHIKTPFPAFAALNIRVVKDGISIAESTFSSVKGSSLVYGVVVFEAQPPADPIQPH